MQLHAYSVLSLSNFSSFLKPFILSGNFNYLSNSPHADESSFQHMQNTFPCFNSTEQMQAKKLSEGSCWAAPFLVGHMLYCFNKILIFKSHLHLFQNWFHTVIQTSSTWLLSLSTPQQVSKKIRSAENENGCLVPFLFL